MRLASLSRVFTLKKERWMHLKVIHPKYSKHWLWQCVCSRILNHGLSFWLKDISTLDFPTPRFNPGLFNNELFNPELFNHEFLNHGVEKIMVEKSGVEKPRVEMSFNLRERWYFNPRLFNHELFNPMVKKSWFKSPGLKSLFDSQRWLQCAVCANSQVTHSQAVSLPSSIHD